MPNAQQQQIAIDKALERIEQAVDGLLKLVSIDQAFGAITDTLDDRLCESLGNQTATRLWVNHLHRTCGDLALKQAWMEYRPNSGRRVNSTGLSPA